MTRADIEANLDARFSTHGIARRLHAVSPHEVYEVRVDGRRGVCKRSTGRTGNAAVEGHVLSFVGERTSVEVPEILCVGDDYYVAA